MDTSRAQEHHPKKRGPAKRSATMVDTHLYIQADLLEWAKAQPEGFAGMVRRLLSEERAVYSECDDPPSH